MRPQVLAFDEFITSPFTQDAACLRIAVLTLSGTQAFGLIIERAVFADHREAEMTTRARQEKPLHRVHHLTLHKAIRATRADVWTVLTTVDRFADVFPSIESVQVLSGGTSYDVGTRWRETRPTNRFRRDTSFLVTLADRPWCTVTQAEFGPVDYVQAFLLEDRDDVTTLHLRLTARLVSPTRQQAAIWRVFGAAAFVNMSRRAKLDLDALARAAEAASTAPTLGPHL